MTNRKNKVKTVLAAMLSMILIGASFLLLTACSGESGPTSIAIVEGVHKNAGVLPLRDDTLKKLLYKAAWSYGSVTLISGDGDPAPVFHASIPEPNVSGLSQQKRMTIANGHVEQLQTAMREVTATVKEVDTLKAIRVAASKLKDAPGERILFVMDTGLSTTGYIDLASDILYASPEDVVEWLRSENALPDLSGIHVIWYWNGTAEPQKDLTESQNSRIRALWHAILDASGAEGNVTDIEGDNGLEGYLESLPDVSCVEPEEIVAPQFELEKPIPEEILETIVLESSKLRFVGNKAEFIDPNEANVVLKQVADQLLSHPKNKVYIAGSAASATAGHDESFCLELSDARAKAVRTALITLGVPEEQMISVGLGFQHDPFHVPDLNENGTEQIEEYAKQNRVVRIVDIFSEDGDKITTYLQ